LSTPDSEKKRQQPMSMKGKGRAIVEAHPGSPGDPQGPLNPASFDTARGYSRS
jgi:hypothetical protein